MSMRTYFAHPEIGAKTLFVSVDVVERRRLLRRGWEKIRRQEAVTDLWTIRLGGSR